MAFRWTSASENRLPFRARQRSASRRRWPLCLPVSVSHQTSLLPALEWLVRVFLRVFIDPPCVVFVSVESLGALCICWFVSCYNKVYRLWWCFFNQHLKIGVFVAHCCSFTFSIFQLIAVRERKTGFTPDQGMGSKRYALFWFFFILFCRIIQCVLCF